ncbi:helix-turn-helix transcriptional regulator [Ornithinimicrobium sp. LYQ121]|uniref:helix-turn-helix transcriptional regulator n=1 Tax=Ornithinimicrobium sp. LYQ121 TaxID=3378801 RepID=UPI0038536874
MNHRTILTLQEVSERTRVPLNTLRWMRHKGTGPPTWKLGRRVVAYEDDVEGWLDQQHEQTCRDGPLPTREGA